MDEAEQQILQMVEDRVITAEEAEKLLAALDSSRQNKIDAGGRALESAPDPLEAASQPEFGRFRHIWRVPLLVACGSLIFSGAGIVLLYQSAEEVAALGFLCLWSIFILALVATGLIWLAGRSPWLHVRVQERGGQRIAISLPVPLGLSSWVLAIARRFVPKEQAPYLETASAFLAVMKDNPEQEPIVIDVDDDDGDKVQVYIG